MLSIIICSASREMLHNATENIKKTVGIPYEIISFENSKGESGICNIYNRGAKIAKYDLLCFMHEDLDIKTQNWGNIVSETFRENKDLGMLGVIGCAYKSAAPTAWEAISFEVDLIYGNFIQSFKHRNEEPIRFFKNPSDKDLVKTVSVDGMWFCVRRDVMSTCQFDESLLKGFHCYDLDFCFQVGQQYNIAVTFKVLIEHYSEGNFNREWWIETLKLHEKWRGKLPLGVDLLPDKTKFLIEKRAYRWTIERLIEMKYSWGYIFKFLVDQKFRGVMDWQLYFKGNLFALKYMVGIKKYPL